MLNITNAVSSVLEKGRRAYLAGRLAEAEQEFRKVLAIEPQNADALMLLGTIAILGSKWAEAESLLRSAIQSKPELAEAHSHLGWFSQPRIGRRRRRGVMNDRWPRIRNIRWHRTT